MTPMGCIHSIGRWRQGRMEVVASSIIDGDGLTALHYSCLACHCASQSRVRRVSGVKVILHHSLAVFIMTADLWVLVMHSKHWQGADLLSTEGWADRWMDSG